MDDGADNPCALLARFFAPGSMVRDPRDLWPLLTVMAGPDGIQPDVKEGMTSFLPSTDALRGRTVYVLSAPRIAGAQQTDEAQVLAVEAAAATLQDFGCTLRTARSDLLKDAFSIWFGTLRCAADFDMEHLLGGGKRIDLLRETFRQISGRGVHTAAGYFLALSSRFDPTGPRIWNHWKAKGERLKAELEAMLADDSLLICPPAPGAAPRHNSAFFHPFNVAHCAVFNALGFPATVSPVSNGPEGLPRGVQIVARRGADYLSVSAALALHDAKLPQPKRSSK